MHYFLLIVAIMMVSCGDKNDSNLVALPEASGIDYCTNSDTLVVVNDEGRIYEIDKDGTIHKEAKIKKYDFEGVVCTDESFLVVVEDQGILKVARDLSTSKLLKIKGLPKNMELFEKKHGVEGIAKNGTTLYLSKQNKKSKINAIVVMQLVGDELEYVKTLEHEIPDIAGLTYHKGYLYMVSDQKEMMAVYDLKKSAIVKSFKLEDFAQEGIAFDGGGFVYFADDNGFVRKNIASKFDF